MNRILKCTTGVLLLGAVCLCCIPARAADLFDTTTVTGTKFVDGPPPTLERIKVNGWRLTTDPLVADGYKLEGPIPISNRSYIGGDRENNDDNSKTKDCSHSHGTGSGGNGTSGNPVVLQTGNKIEPETDFSSPGEMGLYLTRTYNRMWEGVGIFGKYWQSNFDYYLTFGTSRFQTYCYPMPGGNPCSLGSKTVIWATRPDGRRIVYKKNSTDGIFYNYDTSTPSVTHIVVQADGSFILYGEANEVETYSPAGFVTSVKDEHGIGWTYAYSGTYVSRVTHTSGRHVDFVWSNGLLTSVLDPAGNAYGYSYLANKFGAGLNLLSAMSRPGSPATTLTYYYEDANWPQALTGVGINGVRYSWFGYNPNSGTVAYTEHGGGKDRYSFVRSVDATGHLVVTETNPLGKQTAYTYQLEADGDKPLSVTGYGSTHCAGSYREYTYDANNYEDKVSDFNGNLTDYDYNAKGQLVKEVENVGTASARTTTYVWDATKNRATSVTVAGLAKTDYTFTADNRVASMTVTNLTASGVANQARTTTYTYARFANGMISSVVEDGPLAGSADAITTTYSVTGDLLTVRNSLGQQVALSGYNGLGLPGRRVGVNGDITDYTYDAQGRVTLVRTYPGGTAADTSYVYDAQGLLASVKSPDGVVTYYEYDSARRLLDIYRAANGTAGSETSREKQLYTYDLMGNITKVENQMLAGQWETQCNRTVIMDGLPECVEEVQVWVGTPTTTQTTFVDYDELGRVIARRGNNGQNIRYTYDDNGNVATVTDSSGRVTSLAYDAFNRLTTSTDAIGGVTRFEYEPGDHVTKVTDPRGLVTSYVFDGFGQLWAQTSPDTGTSTFEYDASGLRTAMTRAGGQRTTYSYDGLGRIIGVNAGTQSQTFTYDTCANGALLLCQVSDATGSVSYTYTPQGQRASQSSQMPAGGSASVSYTYDSVGRLAGIAYPDGVSAGYGYANGKLTTVTATVNGATTKVASYINYEPFGGVSSWTYGNGLNRGYNHDLDGRITGISVTDGGSAVLQSLTFAYDANDLITKITNGVNAGVTQSYSYDALSRLASLSTGYGDTLNYTFDANGNRTREDWLKNGTTTTTPYTVAPDSNRLTAAVGGRLNRTYTYDASGNPTAISGSSLSYDPFNRLSAVTSSSGVTTSYAVNGLGQRVYKYAPGVGQYWFVYGPDGGLVTDYKSGGQYWTDYIWANGQIVGAVRGQQLYYVAGDQLGRPELITNAAGSAVWRANNYAFNRSLSLAQLEFNIGFPGQYWDAETGNWYNGYRDYDDDTGRYLQSDPIGLAGGVNTFAYAGGNPVSAIDPMGLDTLVILGGGTISNPFGHVAIAFTGHGVYSYGTPTPLGSSLTEYLAAQSQYRLSMLIRINTTPAQEQKMLAQILKYKGIRLPNPKTNPAAALGDTCATRTQASLAAGGVTSSLMPISSPFPMGTGIIGGMNASNISILGLGSAVPSGYESFNPGP